METIKNYLEAMIAGMPDTPEVRKAKAELLQMMEDKYNELISEGQSENTAVGTVISEFGNLDELAYVKAHPECNLSSMNFLPADLMKMASLILPMIFIGKICDFRRHNRHMFGQISERSDMIEFVSDTYAEMKKKI